MICSVTAVVCVVCGEGVDMIAGIDLGGRKAAVARFDPDAPQQYSVHALTVERSDRGYELQTLREWTKKITAGCSHVFIEEPLIGRGVRASLQVAQTAGAVLSAHPNSSLVPVKSWKKVMVGNGNAGKPEVSMWLEKEYPAYSQICGTDQDKRDATVIALYGAHVVADGRELSTSEWI